MGNLANPSKTIEVLREHGIHLTKNFGQNFLVDSNILDIIIENSQVNPKDIVLEIGSGIGTLTEALIESAGQVYAVEVDKRFITILKENLGSYDNLHIIEGDAMQVNLKDHFQQSGYPNKIISNLPYNIATPLLIKCLQELPEIDFYLVMVQEELARRYTARPGSKSYGAPSLKIQYYCYPEIVKKISPNVFLPKPKVKSALVKLKLREKRLLYPEDEQLFLKLVSLSFQRRRKQIGSFIFPEPDLPGHDQFVEALKALGIKLKLRPENLSLEDFINLTKHLSKPSS